MSRNMKQNGAFLASDRILGWRSLIEKIQTIIYRERFVDFFPKHIGIANGDFRTV